MYRCKQKLTCLLTLAALPKTHPKFNRPLASKPPSKIGIPVKMMIAFSSELKVHIMFGFEATVNDQATSG
jgi:hypothetical protein